MPEIVLVRHGETAGQSSIRLWGATDVPLDPVGEGQMVRTGRALAGERFDHVVVSPLCRSRRSAQLVLASAGHPPVPLHAHDALREIDFGAWEGLTHEEAAARDPHTHARWRTEGRSFRFPEGETRAGFEARVIASVRDVFETPLLGARPRLLAVLHKGVIKVVIAHLLGVDLEHRYAMPVDLGSIHRLVGRPSAWTLVVGNDTAHLDAT